MLPRALLSSSAAASLRISTFGWPRLQNGKEPPSPYSLTTSQNCTRASDCCLRRALSSPSPGHLFFPKFSTSIKAVSHLEDPVSVPRMLHNVIKCDQLDESVVPIRINSPCKPCISRSQMETKSTFVKATRLGRRQSLVWGVRKRLPAVQDTLFEGCWSGRFRPIVRAVAAPECWKGLTGGPCR